MAPSATASQRITVRIDAVCDLSQEKDVSICTSDHATVFLSNDQLRTLHIRAGSVVWALPAAVASADEVESSASPAVPVLVHALTERMRAITNVAASSETTAPDGLVHGAVASLPLLAQFSTLDAAAPLRASLSLQLRLPPMDAASLPQAQHVVLRPHLQRHSARHHGRSALPLAFLHSFEFLQLLPSLLQGRIVAPGVRLSSELLSCTHQLAYFEVVEATQQRAQAASAAAASASDANGPPAVALVLTSQTVLSLQSAAPVPLPAALPTTVPAFPASASSLLPAAFPASPAHWMRRVRRRVYGYGSVVQEWVESVWHNVQQYADEAEQHQALQAHQLHSTAPLSGAATPSISAYAPHTFLLHGLSGTGKTHLARTLAACSGLPYFFLETASLFQRTEGASEAALVSLFAAARAHQAAGRPCIVVLDQLDTILPKPPTDSSAPRDGDDDAAGAGAAGLREEDGAGGGGWRMGNSRIEWRLCGVLKELLQELNGLPAPLPAAFPSHAPTPAAASSPPLPPLFVLLTTSSPQALDAAGMRMSPFVDQEIELRALTRDERVEALRLGMRPFVFEEEEQEVGRAAAAAAAAGAGEATGPELLAQRRDAVRQGIFERLASELHGFVGADMGGLVRETLLAALARTRALRDGKRAALASSSSSSSPSSDVAASAAPAAEMEVRIARQDYEGVLEWMQPANLQQLEFRLPQSATPLTATAGEDGEVARGGGTALAGVIVDPKTTPLPFESLSGYFSSLAGITPLLHHLHYSFLLPIKQPQLYESLWRPRLAMAASRGVLLYGRSGTGKSALAICLARACGLNCMVVPATSLVGKVVGSSEKNLAAIFARARASAPALLVFDQMEQLAPVRKGLRGGDDAEVGHDADAYERILSVLLIEMDGVLSSGSASESQVYVVATSTRPDQIDPALLRPGRLDSHVHLSPPTQASRLEILRLATGNTPLLVEVDGAGRVVVPGQWSLAWSVLPRQVRDRIVEWEWSRTVESSSDDGEGDGDGGTLVASSPELKSFFLELLSHATAGYTGADLLSLVRESAMHALRRSLHSTLVRSWTDLGRGVLRHMRGSVVPEQPEYHPFGAVSAGGLKFGCGWAATSSAEFGASGSGHTGSAKLFSKKRAGEIVQRNLTTDAVAAAATAAAASADSRAAATSFISAAASAAPFVFDSGPAAAPFVFDSGAAFAPTTEPFSFGLDSASSATEGSAATAPFSFSMGSADAPPPTKQEKKEGAAAERQSIKSTRPA